MNFYTIDPGYDAEAIEADEWTNQAPEPKTMEWKWKPSTNLNRLKNILFADVGIASKITFFLKNSFQMEKVAVFSLKSDSNDTIDWKDDHIQSGLTLFECKEFYLIQCNDHLDVVYFHQCAEAITTLAEPNSNIAVLKIEQGVPNEESELTIIQVGNKIQIPKESIMITGLGASVMAKCQAKKLNASCFHVTQSSQEFSLLQSTFNQILELFQAKQTFVLAEYTKKIQSALRTRADHMFL